MLLGAQKNPLIETVRPTYVLVEKKKINNFQLRSLILYGSFVCFNSLHPSQQYLSVKWQGWNPGRGGGGGGVYRSLLCILGSFLKVKVQNEDIFWVAKFSNIFWVCLIFQILFGKQ